MDDTAGLVGQKTTENMDASLALDVAKLLKFMVDSKVPGYSLDSKLSVKKFTTGQSNPTYLVDGTMVLRKQPPGGVSNATAHRMDREFLVLQALQKTDVPAPKPIAYCADPNVLGGSFYLMSFIKGRVFSSPALPGMQPNERRAAYRSVIETLAKIHSVDWRSVGLSDYGLAGNMYGRQLSSLLMVSDKQQAVASSVPKIPHRDEVAREMRDNLPDDAVALVHGDYKWDNILIHPTEPRVVGVLDWELSTIGHPMSDVANMCGAIYFSPYNPSAAGGGGVLGMEDIESSGIPSQEEVLQYYSQLTKRQYPDPDMPFYFAFYFWRGAIISQGIGARLAAKQASSSLAKDFAAMTGPLGEMARNQMDALAENRPAKTRALLKGAPGLKLEDSYTHKPSADELRTGFVEETRVQFVEPSGAFSGMASFVNRPSEKKCEVMLIVYLRDGSCLVVKQNAPLASNNGWAMPGVSVDVLRPMVRTRVAVKGKGLRATKPWLLQSGGSPLETMAIEADLTFEAQTGAAAAYGLTKTNYVSMCSVTGSVFARGGDFGTLHLGVKANGARTQLWGKPVDPPLRRCTGYFGANLNFTLALFQGEDKGKGMVQLAEGRCLEATCRIAIRLADADAIDKVDGQWHFEGDFPTAAQHKRVNDVTLKISCSEGVELEVNGQVLGFVEGGAGWTKWTVAGSTGFSSSSVGLGWGVSEVRPSSASVAKM